MTYLYKKSNKESTVGIRYILICVVVIFFLIIKFTFVGGVLNSILSPLFFVGDIMYKNINEIPEEFWSKDRLLQEVRTLREKESDLNLRLADISALQFENTELRKSLGLKPDQNFISAFVVARPPQTSFDTLLINKGKKDGVVPGDLLLASDSVMMGKVVEVKDNSSIVLLNSSPSVYFAASVSRNNEQIEVVGHGSGNLYAKVPISFDLEVGDTIVLNYGDVFTIGVVSTIENEETSGFKNVFLSLPVNVSKLGLVFISSIIESPAI